MLTILRMDQSSQQTSAMSWDQVWIESHRNVRATYDRPALLEEFDVLGSQNQVVTYDN